MIRPLSLLHCSISLSATITDTLGPRLARNGLEFLLDSRHQPARHVLSPLYLSNLDHPSIPQPRPGMSFPLFACLIVAPIPARGETKGMFQRRVPVHHASRSIMESYETEGPLMGSCFSLSEPQSSSRSESTPPLTYTSFAPHHPSSRHTSITAVTHPHSDLPAVHILWSIVPPFHHVSDHVN